MGTRTWAVLVAGALVLLGACSSDGGSDAKTPAGKGTTPAGEAKAPVGLGPELDRLLDSCETKGELTKPCFIGGLGRDDPGSFVETVPGTRDAASDLCRALASIEPAELSGLDVTDVSQGPYGAVQVGCESESEVFITVARRDRTVLEPCRADEQCERLADGSYQRAGSLSDFPLLTRRWENGDRVLVTTGAGHSGTADEKADLLRKVLPAVAGAFNLGR